MSEPAAHKKIVIIGLGLIGGSIGLALKKAGLQSVEIVGHDRDHGNENLAKKMGAIDRGEQLPRAVSGAGLVIIASPILTVREVMQQIAPSLAAGAIVTDTASTKSFVMRWASEEMPENVSFVGGHPMAGKETQGIQNAEADLFQDRPWVLVPSVAADPLAVRSMVGLVQLVGAQPLFMDADEHDQYAAAVSHMPLMMSTALFTLLHSSPAWPDMGGMAAGGFRDMTRLASGDPAMSHGIWRTNREAVIHWLERMSAEMLRFRDMLQDARDEDLLETFATAQLKREQFLAEPPRRVPAEGVARQVDGNKAMIDMLIGGMMADQLRRAQNIPELMRQELPDPPAKRGKEGEEPPAPAQGKKKMTLGDKLADDIRRDLEKLEKKRAEKADKEK